MSEGIGMRVGSPFLVCAHETPRGLKLLLRAALALIDERPHVVRIKTSSSQ